MELLSTATASAFPPHQFQPLSALALALMVLVLVSLLLYLRYGSRKEVPGHG